MIKGVVFDMDGTLLDTEKLYIRFWIEAAQQMGYPMELRHALMIRGTAPDIAEGMLKRELGENFAYFDVRQLRTELMEAFVAQHGVELKPGARETLEALKAKGYRIALATASNLERATRSLKQAGLYEYFDCITCAAMVKRGKPAPDLFLYAAQQLGLAPPETVAVEDAPNGIRAAHDAGLVTVMVPDQDQPGAETRALCDAVLPSLFELMDWMAQRV